MGIGASAGGLDAFRRLLQRIPPDTGLALVLVPHLDPTHESLLPELLGRDATVPVIAAQDGMRVAADHAYVIPPNATMTVTDGHLWLVTRKSGHHVHLPIDAFLCSLAEVQGSNVVGVILSGSGSDGARGIQAIKEAGGITIAQDGATAAYPSMPESAVATGYVDFVLTPEEIAEQLVRLGRHPASHPSDEAAGAEGTAEEELRKILVLLERRTGVDFQHYRRGTVHRRILRRMLLHRQDTREEYLAHLRINPTELDALHDELLIGVTNFFRDQDVFAYLRGEGFARLIEGHAPGTPVRVWVAGCAGGEEAYSLAIALIEFLGDSAPRTPIQVFGTDLSEASLAKARAGVYPEGITADVSPERLQRFFVKQDGGYRISKEIRGLCVFSRHNVVRDPPFSHLHLVSCRNLLIYLEPLLQRRVFPILHYALEPHGLLVLGSAESVGPRSELFVPLSKRHKIYRRVAKPTRVLDINFAAPGAHPVERRRLARVPAFGAATDDVQSEADRVVLGRYAPAGVVINEHLEVIQFRGDTAAFLAHGPGTASLELLKLARPELAMPLQVAVPRARQEGRPVREGPIAIVDGNEARHVAIEVIPFRPPSTSARFFVVLFEEGRGPPTTVSTVPDAVGTGGKARSSSKATDGRELQGLREELAATKRYLQAILEEHESTQEELRAANEEIQSSNEELQSTNEELETSKEEVQSTNEELVTVNDELRLRNRELVALASDLSNVLAGTTIPIVIVGRDLRLRRFTPASERVMKVISSDVGRPFSDIKLRVPLPDVEQRLRGAIETLTATEQEVQDEAGHWWSLTIRPYQTVDGRVDGAVLVFGDIDASKRYGEDAEQTAEARRLLLVAAEEARAAAEQGKTGAEIANRAKSDFLANMSHDLRTPLNAIAGYTQLLELGVHGPVTDAQRTDFGRIERNAHHLLALINDILNFVKLEGGHLQFHITSVPVAEVIGELEDMIAPVAGAKLIRLRQSAGEAIVRADPERVRQILLNLLTNAVKFTAPSGQLGIRCSETGDVIRIEVWDTGIGIGPDQLIRIFEPFVQVGRGLTSSAPSGVGLGLTISRDLARAMGGDLTVVSALGEGSTFTVSLPRFVA